MLMLPLEQSNSNAMLSNSSCAPWHDRLKTSCLRCQNLTIPATATPTCYFETTPHHHIQRQPRSHSQKNGQTQTSGINGQKRARQLGVPGQNNPKRRRFVWFRLECRPIGRSADVMGPGPCATFTCLRSRIVNGAAPRTNALISFVHRRSADFSSSRVQQHIVKTSVATENLVSNWLVCFV